jgi:hypothetical protein
MKKYHPHHGEERVRKSFAVFPKLTSDKGWTWLHTIYCLDVYFANSGWVEWCCYRKDISKFK